jgi:hypothetical protein
MIFKVGDIVMFKKDVTTEPSDGRKTKIPKFTPCIIEKINKHHVWVKYNKKVIWLRLIEKRMFPATEAGIVLFGDQSCIKTP